MQLELPSVQSLFVEAQREPIGGGPPLTLSTGTAFGVTLNDRHFLVTNWHVVTGRKPGTTEPAGSSAALPSTLRVWHNARNNLGVWVAISHRLYDEENRANWLVDHIHRSNIDIVALALDDDDRVDLYPYVLDFPLDIGLTPTLEVSIVGFPFGIRSNGSIGVWSRGTIASEPGLDWAGHPAFLIDSRTRPGQSGSPVIHHSNVVPGPDGGLSMYSGYRTTLLGIYSGRVSEQSDLGIVWRTDAIRTVVQAGVQDTMVFE